MFLNIRHVIHQFRFGIIDRDGHDFPIQLSLINHGQHTQRLHLHHLTDLALSVPNFNHIHYSKQQMPQILVQNIYEW